jgi:diguanylate cyclase (GGDEF)-like protein
MDLDHFKRVNDAHGHPAGDAVLSEAARRMAAAVRPYDPVGRYGGEEFLITVPGCDEDRATVVAERLRVAVADGAFRSGELNLTLTASLGVAVLSGEANASASRLIAAADSALYRAKAGGRNRIVFADAPAVAASAEDPFTEKVLSRQVAAPVDLSRLRQVSFDDDALRAELLDLFVVSTANRLPTLRSALESGDTGLAEGEARAIKGESSHLGAARLGDLAFRLERACRDRVVHGGRNLMREIEEEFVRVRAFVDELTRER